MAGVILSHSKLPSFWLIIGCLNHRITARLQFTSWCILKVRKLWAKVFFLHRWTQLKVTTHKQSHNVLMCCVLTKNKKCHCLCLFLIHVWVHWSKTLTNSVWTDGSCRVEVNVFQKANKACIHTFYCSPGHLLTSGVTRETLCGDSWVENPQSYWFSS